MGIFSCCDDETERDDTSQTPLMRTPDHKAIAAPRQYSMSQELQSPVAYSAPAPHDRALLSNESRYSYRTPDGKNTGRADEADIRSSQEDSHYIAIAPTSMPLSRPKDATPPVCSASAVEAERESFEEEEIAAAAASSVPSMFIDAVMLGEMEEVIDILGDNKEFLNAKLFNGKTIYSYALKNNKDLLSYIFKFLSASEAILDSEFFTELQNSISTSHSEPYKKKQAGQLKFDSKNSFIKLIWHALVNDLKYETQKEIVKYLCQYHPTEYHTESFNLVDCKISPLSQMIIYNAYGMIEGAKEIGIDFTPSLATSMGRISVKTKIETILSLPISNTLFDVVFRLKEHDHKYTTALKFILSSQDFSNKVSEAKEAYPELENDLMEFNSSRALKAKYQSTPKFQLLNELYHIMKCVREISILDSEFTRDINPFWTLLPKGAQETMSQVTYRTAESVYTDADDDVMSNTTPKPLIHCGAGGPVDWEASVIGEAESAEY